MRKKADERRKPPPPAYAWGTCDALEVEPSAQDRAGEYSHSGRPRGLPGGTLQRGPGRRPSKGQAHATQLASTVWCVKYNI